MFLLTSDQYEEWCHIVDKALFAPNGGQFQTTKMKNKVSYLCHFTSSPVCDG